jgi:hypothetical protein
VNYAAHISELCERLGARHIRIEVLEGSYSTRDPEPRIVTPPVKDALTYWVALHELGHLACEHEPHADFFGVSTRTLEKEGEAWLWALENAREPMQPDTAARCVSFLQTYLRAAEDDYPPHQAEQAYALLRRTQLALTD